MNGYRFTLHPESFALHCSAAGIPLVPLANEQFTVECARGDWAAASVVIESEMPYLLAITTAPCLSKFPGRPVLRVEAECLAPVTLAPVAQLPDDDGTLRADLLLTGDSVEVEGVTQLWVETAIPADTAPGDYTCTLRFFAHAGLADEMCIQTLSFPIRVWNKQLPETGGMHLDLWQHPSNIARKHETPLWSEAHFRVLKPYLASLAELGQSVATVIASEMPWSGQCSHLEPDYPSDLFEYSMIRVEKDAAGEYHYDFSVLERYLALCERYGIDAEYEVFGLINIWVHPEVGHTGVAEDFPDAIRIVYRDADGCKRYMRTAAEISDYIRALEGFFVETGRIDRVRVVADEPADLSLHIERLKNLRAIAPRLRFKCAINHLEFLDQLDEWVDDYVPCLPYLKDIEGLRARVSGRLCHYLCCWPDYPNTFLRSPLLEGRLIGALTAYYKLDGFLRWNYTVWPEHPREKISYHPSDWKAGDTNFVYPSNNGTPLLSLRYKALKRGMEDYRLIVAGGNPAWENIIFTPNLDAWYGEGADPKKLYSTDYEDYSAFRASLLKE